MHLRVNGTRKNEKSSAAMPFSGRHWTGSHCLHQAVSDQNMPIIDHPIGQHDGSCEDLIRHTVLSIAAARFLPAKLPLRYRSDGRGPCQENLPQFTMTMVGRVNPH